jgi:hypothetical protein
MTSDLQSCRSLEEIIVAHYLRYPRMQVRDIYKLAHQSCLGSAHAVADVNEAALALRAELDGIEARNDTGSDRGGFADERPTVSGYRFRSALEPIAPGGVVMRAHLRPWLQEGRSFDLLLSAFVKTANELPSDEAGLAAAGEGVAGLCEEGRLPFRGDEVLRLWQRMAASGFPPVRHSPAYRIAYRPAYRVVALESLGTS